MDDVFNVIPSETVTLLEEKVEKLFSVQRVLDQATDLLATDPTNKELRADLDAAIALNKRATVELEEVPLAHVNLLKNYKGITEEEVRGSNRYYSQYGSDYSVENLAWSNERLLNMCEELP